MKTVLIVGPCYADAIALSRSLKKEFNVKTVELTKINEALDYLKQRSCDLILVSRICKGDNRSGFELVDYVKINLKEKPIIMLTRFPEHQQEAKQRGATDAFDMDILIGYIRPSMKEKHALALNTLKKILT